MDVVIATWSDVPAIIERLRLLGYHHEGDLGMPGREAFTTPPDTPPHHLYICAIDSPQLARHLAFREYLRAHPDAARAYSELKRFLAQRFRADRRAYSDAKNTSIECILEAPDPGHAGRGWATNVGRCGPPASTNPIRSHGSAAAGGGRARIRRHRDPLATTATTATRAVPGFAACHRTRMGSWRRPEHRPDHARRDRRANPRRQPQYRYTLAKIGRFPIKVVRVGHGYVVLTAG